MVVCREVWEGRVRDQIDSQGVEEVLAHLDAVVLVHVTLDDRLDDVVDVVVVVLDDVLALVDNGALTLALGELVAGGVERGELGLVFTGRDVLLCRVVTWYQQVAPSRVSERLRRDRRDPPLISVVGTTFLSTCSVPCWVSRTGWTWCWTWWTVETRNRVQL